MSTAETRQLFALTNDAGVLDRAATDLAAKYCGTYSPETVRALIDDSYRLLAPTSRITTYLPVLSVRFASERLAAIARHEGHLVTTAPEVLFVCVHNAGRSQMAAALLNHYARGEFTSAPPARPRPTRSTPPSSRA